MRVVRVSTNETCNQNCGFCNARSPVDQPSFVAPAAVRARLTASLLADVRELRVTGGEPTLRRDLPELVAFARDRAPATRIVLETNAALVTSDLARRLRAAGLDVARVHLPAWGEAADRITRDPGGFAHTRAGMDALAAAGITVEATTPIVRDNVETVASLPTLVAAEAPFVATLRLLVPVEAPDPALLAPLDVAARAIEAIDRAARGTRIALYLDAHGAVPPCLFEHPSRVSHLFSLSPGGAERPGFVHLAHCGECAVRDRCPGFPTAAIARLDADRPLRPIREDRVRRRLSIVSTVTEQIARELVTRDAVVHNGERVVEHIVRINFRCNQACHFCFVSTHLPAAPDADVRSAILEVGRLRGRLVLSGGEPTLNPKLLEWVALGRESGAREIELQTNATRLAEPGVAHALADAGVDVAFVSLHGSTAAISDAITAAPGTFEKTVRGIDALAATTISIRLNFVFCRTNYADFPAFARLVASRWPRAGVTISFVAASTDLVPCDTESIPRYADVMPALAAGVRDLVRSGIAVTGFESMCGIPLCVLPSDLRTAPELLRPALTDDRGEFVRTDACRECSLNDRCYGLRRRYAALHGTGELASVGA